LGISQSSTFLGLSTGFLYVSDPTSTYDLFPDAPYLFGVLIHQVEFPTAQCFPIRLLLRLGYEYQSKEIVLSLCKREKWFLLGYPWPLFSIVNRDAMFNDTQHTIMSLLCVNIRRKNFFSLIFFDFDRIFVHLLIFYLQFVV
jgi:MAD (mothers against decapentaplegic) interacting protein